MVWSLVTRARRRGVLSPTLRKPDKQNYMDMAWITGSNRWKHLLGGFAIGLALRRAGIAPRWRESPQGARWSTRTEHTAQNGTGGISPSRSREPWRGRPSPDWQDCRTSTKKTKGMKLLALFTLLLMLYTLAADGGHGGDGSAA